MVAGFPLSFPFAFGAEEGICGPNLLPNPSFDSGLNGWGQEAGWSGGTAPTWNSTQGRTAAGSLRWTDVGAISYVYSAALVVEPGQQLNASAWTRWGGGAPGWRADIGVTFTNVDDNWLGDLGTTFRYSDDGIVGWAEITTRTVAPENAKFARMWLEVRPGTGPGWIDWDDISLCRIGDPFPIPPPLVPPVSVGTPSSPIITDNQIVSLHTASGITLYQFLAEDYTSCSWGRTSRDASQCDLSVPPLTDIDRLPDIVPWAHWLSVWDGDRDVLLWTGPIQSSRANRRGLSINAKDHAAYLSRTRNPTTKRWDAADPAWVAGELWAAMIEQKGLAVKPIVRADPEGDRFDFQVITDAQMLDQTLTDLVNMGLRWTVVSGAPIIGPLSLDPVAALGEQDFLGDGIDLVRDGSQTFNDVIVRGPDNIGRASTDYYGQNLQTIANVDNMFGLSNVEKAAQQYVRNTGTVRTRLELGGSTVLHPDAPINIDELMPSARFVIEAAGIRQLMILTSVQVERRAGGATVQVTMDSLPDRDIEGHLIELAQNKNAPVVTLGGQAVNR